MLNGENLIYASVQIRQGKKIIFGGKNLSFLPLTGLAIVKDERHVFPHIISR